MGEVKITETELLNGLEKATIETENDAIIGACAKIIGYCNERISFREENCEITESEHNEILAIKDIIAFIEEEVLGVDIVEEGE